jgi:superfamily II DNA or RNA helicase
MSDIVTVEFLDHVHMRVTADPSVRQEISDFFSFRPEGWQYHPKVKTKMWDGIIRIYSPMRPKLYVGLLEKLKEFCDVREYDLNIETDEYDIDICDENYPVELAEEIGCKFEPRDYQCEYIINAIANNRTLSVSPTSSGKSLIIYLLQQHYWRTYGHRTLIIVPTIGLVHQMAGDFIDYGCTDPIYKIQGGVDKHSDDPIVISTWQSLTKMPKEWFDQFNVVLGDEAHLFQAKSLTTIMEKLIDCKFRHGFTGTLKSSESKTHRMVLEGCFGPVKRAVTTKNLIDAGTVADFNVKSIVLLYDDATKKTFRDAYKKIDNPAKRYPAEREFLINHQKRNMFIRNLVWSLEGQNNLILFDLVEKHGKILEPLLRKDGRELHFIYGGTKGDERERIRHMVENDPEKRHDILASYGVFSTGVNLKKLDNVIFASGSKSEIKVLQSIGRTLRKGNDADKAVLYDIADDLTSGSFTNYTMNHFRKRIEIYSDQEFQFKIYSVEI